ncbi:hypothetical protein I302_107720 [Kwoniella bestiolae CBS 10118]|uniref:Amine oxidase n=1 Tax=Kwoniella bestiolae CBS 10118 TaxID=1296100 RepID=A0A1B9FXQ3_9TREE|nr:hypothetical protein I302_06541 [Kwoniella bestiolae CBS 10118]OCF23558.1 hypothetical protein I302_06541 [Kwoniella bestiolae CBS 10118]
MFTANLLTALVLCVGAVINASPLAKRDAGPLFGSSGLPSYQDIVPHHRDSAYVVTVMTLTYIAPEYVESLISFEGDGDYSSIEEVTATSWTLPGNGTGTGPEMRKTKIRREDVSLRNDTKSDIWWGGALYQAPIKEGTVVDPEGQGGMPSLYPTEAMTILTGKKAEMDQPTALHTFWARVSDQNPKESPVMLATKKEGCNILSNDSMFGIIDISEALSPFGNGTVLTLLDLFGKELRISSEQAVLEYDHIAYWPDKPSFKDVRAP